MKFYVYPSKKIHGKIRWEYDRFFLQRWCSEACEALLNHENRVETPEDADFFVVSSTLQCTSFVPVKYHRLNKMLRSLPYWSTGKKHVVFDLTDNPKPIFYDPQLIVCKSAFHQNYYQKEHCVAIPQFPRFRFDRDVPKIEKRMHIAGFKGNLRAKHTGLRKELALLDDDKDFMIKTGKVTSDSISFTQQNEPYETDYHMRDSHTSLLFNSKFTLLPRGNGYALSYRKIECMNAGSIPVIISDDYVLPFSEILDYRDFSIRIKEREINHLPQILNDPKIDTVNLQKKVIEVYHNYFSTTKKIIHTTISICSKIIQGSAL